MYKVKLNNKHPRSYYNVTLTSSDDSHYINIYISKEDDGIWVLISKSEDGFYFKSPSDVVSDLQICESESFEETCTHIKTHFLNKGYKFSGL